LTLDTLAPVAYTPASAPSLGDHELDVDADLALAGARTVWHTGRIASGSAARAVSLAFRELKLSNSMAGGRGEFESDGIRTPRP
jgi:hypothetical protein